MKATPEGLETRLEVVKNAFVRLMTGFEGTFAERETKALAFANEVVRDWSRQELEKVAGRFDDEVVVAGQRYRRHVEGTCTYHTLCGPVRVARHTYRLVGMHNGPTVVPLEIVAGIRENATPALAYSATQGFAVGPLRAYESEMVAAHRVVPARSTLERIAKRVGAAVHHDLATIEPVVRSAERLHRAAHSISVGIDRTSVPMAEPTGLPPKRQRRHHRQPPAPVEVHYRMAYIGTLAVNDSAGDVLTSVRFAATVAEGPAEMMERLAAEVRHLLDQRPRLPVVIIQDGAPELRRLVDEWSEDFRIPIEMHLIDRYHVDERLAQTAELLEPNRVARWQLVDTWKRSMARSDLAISKLCRSFRALVRDLYDDDEDLFAAPISRATVHGEAARVIEGHLTYFGNNTSRFGYATARRKGYPVGSGVTEGACKSVIAARCKRSGQRWQEPGLSPCLILRTLHLNGRLRASVDLLIECRRNELLAS